MSKQEAIFRSLSFESRKALGQQHIKYLIAKGYRMMIRAKQSYREHEDRENYEAVQELIHKTVSYDLGKL